MSDPLAPKTPRDSATELAELIMPQHANILGKAFGGVILALIDKAAGAASIRHAGRTCVTAQVDRITFHGPIEIGELVRILACVNYVGRTSMEVGVKVLAMNVQTGEQRRTNTCYVTMVAIDEQGKPAQVPPLRPETDEELRRHRQARERMAARKTQRLREKDELEG